MIISDTVIQSPWAISEDQSLINLFFLLIEKGIPLFLYGEQVEHPDGSTKI
jgi:hypothetical protein